MAKDGKKVSTSLPLLQHTQEYLQLLLEKKAPETLLLLAWQDFYRIYDNLIRAFAVGRGLQGADVDDCAQEVWSEVAKKLYKFERPENRPGLRAWLYALVRSKAIDLLRKRQRQVGERAIAAVSQTGSVEQCYDPALDRQWDSCLAKTMLDDLRQSISDISFQVLWMRSIEGLEVAEVAQVLGISADQVRARHHRAMEKLRSRRAFYTGALIGELA